MFDWPEHVWLAETLPGAFPIGDFPKVKSVVIEIRRSAFRDWEAGVKLTAEQDRALVTTNIGKLTEYIHKAKADVHITVKHTNALGVVCCTSRSDRCL